MRVEDYLNYSSKPNCEYVDGELRSKAWASGRHGLIQFLLSLLLRQQGVDARPEVTVKLSPTRYLVPDVIAAESIPDDYPTQPVMLCVEILSPEDRVGAVLAKCEEYQAWGVPHCWVIDPVKQSGWEYDAQGEPEKVEAGGTLHAGGLAMLLGDLFATQ
jgi:Uma2 family endonuclease